MAGMFEPPAGFDDLLGDAEHAPEPRGCRDLVVPDVGTVRARHPRPAAIATLAMAYNDKTPAGERGNYLARFVRDHLDVGEFERITLLMVDGELTVDPIEQTARAIATWGTARPYLAVVHLAVTAGFNWRMVRLKIGQAGHDPMGLPSMHTVLDWAEDIVLESMQSADPDADKAKRAAFTDKLYRPESPPKASRKRGERVKRPPPPGFSPEEVEASYRAATRALRGG